MLKKYLKINKIVIISHINVHKLHLFVFNLLYCTMLFAIEKNINFSLFHLLKAKYLLYYLAMVIIVMNTGL